ncbi:MAG: hypothetical protein IH946_08365, partial [Bacteroidetes bacterium]|nr:hypothetical protein [Bacteroidota bacterium]
MKFLLLLIFTTGQLNAVFGQLPYVNKLYNKDSTANGCLVESVFSNGSYYVAIGSAWLPENDHKRGIYFLKTDLQGNPLVEKSVWIPGKTIYSGLTGSIKATKDGGFIIGGWIVDSLQGQAMLIKFTADGDTSFIRLFGGAMWDIAYQSGELSNGDIILLGSTESFGSGSGDVYLIRTDANGVLIFDTTYGGPSFDIGTSLAVLDSDEILISGGTDSYGLGLTDGFIYKLDNEGEIIWTKTYGTIGDDCAVRISAGDNDRIIFTHCIDTTISIGDQPF